MNEKQLAQSCGVSDRTLRTWRQRGCKATTTADVLAWRARNIAPQTNGKGSAELIDAQRRKLTAEADCIELRVAKLRSSLIDRAEADDVWQTALAAARKRLDRFTAEASAELPTTREALFERIGTAVHACLIDLSRIGTDAPLPVQ